MLYSNIERTDYQHGYNQPADLLDKKTYWIAFNGPERIYIT